MPKRADKGLKASCVYKKKPSSKKKPPPPTLVCAQGFYYFSPINTQKSPLPRSSTSPSQSTYKIYPLLPPIPL